MLKKIVNFILDFIWPEFCLGCRKEGSLCCERCTEKLILLPATPEHWPDLPHPYFDACYISIDYENPLIQKLIKCYKYDYIQKISDILTALLYQQALQLNLPDNTVITNVPLHHRRQRERGFDQTEVLAKKLAARLSLTYIPLLKRIRKTKSQAKLAKLERKNNVAGAFAVSGAAPRLTRRGPILLIDDVATTGATLNEAAGVLKDYGYKKIICLVIAKNNP
ncbi:MAG: phosphoribosyltransferase [Parcubacteria group bacterium]|nr:MAG: phosphoribosyltransferase [Parcubacteria group bacterium]